MIVKDEDLNRFVGTGDDFEKMVHDLIRAEAWVCGIAPDQIDWDYRTNVPDGEEMCWLRWGASRLTGSLSHQ